MGCAPSQPQHIESKVVTDASVNGSRQHLKRTDSGRSNSSSLRRAPPRKASITPTVNPINGFHRNGDDSVASPTTDPRWTHLWQTHRDLLLDPADMHAAMEACMSNITNKLSVTEITFLQRKVRSIVRQSTNNPDKGARMTNILRTNPNSSQEQETKAIADRYHLLTNHVVKKVLPKLPAPAETALHETNEPMNGGVSTIADNVFLLGIFLHESLWDRVAKIASSTALETGAEMDANHYKLPDETPHPVAPVTSEAPDIPPGMSLHTLAFIIALALSKYIRFHTERPIVPF